MSDARCRIYEDSIGPYIKHGTGVGRPESDKHWNRIYPQAPTSFSVGDIILKHHHPQTTRLRVRNLDQTVQEQWYLEAAAARIH